MADLKTTQKAVEDYFNDDFHEELQSQDGLELWEMLPCAATNDLYQFGRDLAALGEQGQLRVEGDPEDLQKLIVYRS